MIVLVFVMYNCLHLLLNKWKGWCLFDHYFYCWICWVWSQILFCFCPTSLYDSSQSLGLELSRRLLSIEKQKTFSERDELKKSKHLLLWTCLVACVASYLGTRYSSIWIRWVQCLRNGVLVLAMHWGMAFFAPRPLRFSIDPLETIEIIAHCHYDRHKAYW